jgi:hypothetical protein
MALRPRSSFHDILKTFTDNVYFQPPTNVQLKYPCIIYERDYAKTEFGDNLPYNYTKRYMVTVIDRDPDSTIPEKVAALPMSTFNRFYTADDLNHDVYSIFF